MIGKIASKNAVDEEIEICDMELVPHTEGGSIRSPRQKIVVNGAHL